MSQQRMMSKKKPAYPVIPALEAYLDEYSRKIEIPIYYDDLLRFSGSVVVYDANEEDTLWVRVFYPDSEREEIDREWFAPYLAGLRSALGSAIDSDGFACHLSIHTFTRDYHGERREVDVDVDWVGFAIPNEFVVGYGLDYDEVYRNLPYIVVLKPSVYGDVEPG